MLESVIVIIIRMVIVIAAVVVQHELHGCNTASRYNTILPLEPCDSDGVELMGVRGCTRLRQALGVAGVRALDRLLQVRMIDSLQRLSAALTTASSGRQLSVRLCILLACRYNFASACR